MKCIKARERDNPNALFATQQSCQIRTDEGSLAGDLSCHHGAPISSVVPREQVARKSVSQCEQEKTDADYPGCLAKLLVGNEEKDLSHMHNDDNNHQARAPVM